jgi:hypothetical protein
VTQKGFPGAELRVILTMSGPLHVPINWGCSWDWCVVRLYVSSSIKKTLQLFTVGIRGAFLSIPW